MLSIFLKRIVCGGTLHKSTIPARPHHRQTVALSVEVLIRSFVRMTVRAKLMTAGVFRTLRRYSTNLPTSMDANVVTIIRNSQKRNNISLPIKAYQYY